jgi:uncharacterized protein YbjT (DUF2867 family)
VKILLAGGTGFLGRHIGKALLEAGHDLTVLSRHPEEVTRIRELAGANAIHGDVTKPHTLVGTMEGADAVVGATQFHNHPVEVPRKGRTYDNYDRLGTEYLLGEAERAGVKRYAYVSGAGADSASDKKWYRAKGFAEEAIIKSGLEYAIVRPSWAYGPEDRALNRLATIAKFSPVVPRLGVGPQYIQPVYVEDIALTFQRLFERDDAWDQTFEVGGPKVMSMHEVLQTMLEALGKRRLIVPIPTPLAKLGTAPLVLLPSPPMTPFGIEFAVQDGVVDTSLLHKVLDVHPVELREGLARYMGSR